MDVGHLKSAMTNTCATACLVGLGYQTIQNWKELVLGVTWALDSVEKVKTRGSYATLKFAQNGGFRATTGGRTRLVIP